MGIEWQEGVVCFAGGSQFKDWDANRGELITVDNVSILDFETALSFKDFQPNTIKQGDFIAASELDAEQEYQDAVEVFELFSFNPYLNCNMDIAEFILTAVESGRGLIADSDGDLVIDYNDKRDKSEKKRKITFNQLMAIGELRRLEIERDKAVNVPPNHFIPKAGEYAVSDKEFEKSAPKIAPDLTPYLVNNQEVRVQKNKPVVAQVMIDLTERMEIGIKTYGEALRANNGRDALQDAYEEALDLACYLKQAMIERDSKECN